MNIDIRDVNAVRSLRPLETVTYLRSTGWTQAVQHPQASVWTRQVGDEEFEPP